MPLFHKICFLFLLFSLGLSAQNPHPYFKNYTTDDGLPSPEIHYCIQDTAGYMWFATDNGVSRFDGYEFKKYGAQKGLKHPVVLYMQQDVEGKIWLATLHGDLYYIEKDSIHAFAQNEMIRKERAKGFFVTDFFIDTLNNKYLSIGSSGIFKFSALGKFEKICPDEKIASNLAVKINERWIKGNISTPPALDEKYPIPVGYLARQYPIMVQTSSNYVIDTILIKPSRTSSHFYHYLNDATQLGFTHSLFYKLRKEKIIWRWQSDWNMQMKSIIQKSDGEIWLGLLEGKGIRKFKNVDNIPRQQYEKFLKGISITDIFQDRQNGYWVASVEDGIFYTPDFELKIFDESAGLPANHITAFAFKNAEEMFIGFRNGKLVLLNIRTNQITSIRTPTSNFNIIYDLFYDKKRKELWATTGQAFALNKNNIWERVRLNTKLDVRLTSPFIKKMSIGRKQDILWGTSHLSFGAVVLDTKEKFFHTRDTDFTKRCLKVWEDQNNRIWVGTVDGLMEFKNGKVIPPEPFFEVLQTRIEDINELSDGTLVLATKGEGLVLWKENDLQQLTTKNGLTSNMLENVYVDEQDQIWVGTLEGLNKITRRDGDFFIEKYTTHHGLPSNEITQVKAHAGQLWIATTKGLIKWVEKSVSKISPTPKFSKILVNNLPYDFSQNNRLNYQQDNLEIHFLTINYRQYGKIPYRFRLNDGAWTTTQNRSVNFANLANGTYRFEVQSQNENEIWSASQMLDFTIRPAFWQTTWFTFLWVGALLGIAFLVYRNRLNRIRKEAQTDKEINELQRSALRAQMNPHFIFNCLNSIQNFILQNDQLNATKYLGQFAQLIRSTLNASMEEKITLEEEVKMIENYLNLEKLRFKEKMEFSIVVDKQLHQYDTMLPPMLTQPFVENALIHGLAKRKEKGKIEIAYRKQKEKLEISIQDNGPGIFQTQKEKVQSDSTRKGVGMSISQKRMALVAGNYDFEVKEIKDDAGKILGTEVKILLDVEK